MIDPMLGITDVSGVPEYVLPDRAHAGQGSCASCEAYHPDPLTSGALRVDPEIRLHAIGMDVDIAYYYNSNVAANTAFGYGRTISPNLTAQASGSPVIVTLARGNGQLVSYVNNGSGTYIPSTAGLTNTLAADTVNGFWEETTWDGKTSYYPYNTAGTVEQITKIVDSVGNTQSFLYSGGLLANIEDSAGRLVTFGYNSGLLSYIEDWAARRTTFQYNTTSVPGVQLLTTVTGPSGCQTGYGYSSVPLLTSITDPNGYLSQYAYDSQQRVITKELSGIGTSTYTYGTGSMQILDPTGGVFTMLLDGAGQIVGTANMLGQQVTITRNSQELETARTDYYGSTVEHLYNSASMPVGMVDQVGNATTITRDSYNNPVTIQKPNGSIWTTLWGYTGSSFDTTGAKRRPQVTIDPLGNRVTMVYTSQGLLQSTMDMTGALVTLGYNAFGDQISRQDALSNLWTTTRDLAGNAIAQMNPLGAIWSQTFDPQNRPLAATDPLNSVTQNGYDSVGNRTVAITPLGYRTTWTYNAFNREVSRQDALNNLWTTLYDSIGRPICSIDPLNNYSTVVWDMGSQAIARVNPLGNIWTSFYDIAGRMLGTMNPLGFTDSVEWDEANRRIGSVDGLGNIFTSLYDANSMQIAALNPLGFLASTVYDLASRPVAQVDALNNRSSTTWDGRNLAVAQIDALGRITTTIYNANRAAIATMDPGGFLVTATLDAAGRYIGSLDANNNLSTTVFDIANRPIARINALNYRSSTTYDADSNPIQMIDPLNRISTNVMDALDRVQATITPLGYIATINRDADGRTISVQNASGFLNTSVWDNASRQIASVSPLGYRATTIYNLNNQVIGNQNALGQIYTTVRDAANRPIAVINPLNYITSAVFDSASQRIASIDALGSYATSVYSGNGSLIASQSELGFLTSFILDAASQRICVVDANNGRSTTVYSSRGYVAAEQDQLGALTSFTQDPNGNTILRVDARNWPTTYTMDALNRTAQTQYIDNTRVTNTWDAASQQITSQDVTGITSLVWDNDSRKVATQNPTGINLTSTLDPLGNRLVLQDNYGSTSYTWDNQSRLLSIWNPVNERTSLTWDALDREQHRVLANGGTVSHTWDAAGRETLIENRNAAGVGQFIATNTYSPVDNRLTVVELDNTLCTFQYDASSQIIYEARSGTYAYARSYVWDPLGNRLKQYDSGALTSSTFNAANELLVVTPPSGAASTYSYDSAGNTIGINTGGALTTQTWSPENRLLEYASGSTTESYQYSQDGLRKEKVNSSTTTIFTWDGRNVLLETNTSNVLQARYTDYPGYWGGLASQNRSGVSSYYGFDSQASTRILVSSAGVITDSYSYKAFGEELQAGSGTVNPACYVGLYFYYRDRANVGYVRARIPWYLIGRWVSRDSTGFAGGDWNVCRYVGNDPIARIDPSGRQGCVYAQGDCCSDEDNTFWPSAKKPYCPGGNWEKPGGIKGTWRSGCQRHIQARTQFKETAACLDVQKFLQQIGSVCERGTATRDDYGGENAPVGALTHCCWNGKKSTPCSIRICSSGVARDTSGDTMCSMQCLWEHELAHYEMCFNATDPGVPGDPNKPGDLFDEGCGWATQALCLIRTYSPLCKGTWDDGVVDGVFKSCNNRLTNAPCKQRIIGGTGNLIISVM